MHFQVKKTFKNNRNHTFNTTTKHFIHVLLLHINFNYNFYQTHI